MFKKDKEYDKLPYKLYEIVTMPITDESNKKHILASRRLKITGKAIYHQVLASEMDETSTKLLMILGENAEPVFLMDQDHIFSVKVLMEEDMSQRRSPANLKVIHNGTK